MKHILKTFPLLLLILITHKAEAQNNKPGVSKEPSWVTINKIDYSSSSLDKLAEDGYSDLDYEIQVNLAEQTRYFREVKKILSNTGVQNASQVSVSFDPTYQKLNFHSIKIIRNGKDINKLNPSAIKVVNQETDLSNFLYNGTINAFTALDDIRKGDIIEYSYSIKGFNPIFKNKFSSGFVFQMKYPFYNLYYKVVAPPERKLFFRNINTQIQATLSKYGNNNVYEWKLNNLLPLDVQDLIPDWYDPFPQVDISEYADWKEVNEWAKGMYPKPTNISPAIKNLAAKIKSSYTDNASRAAAAVRFVQDELRYMGFEMGTGSHKPANPNKVFEQRFGDCKEKTYLLVTLLGLMGIEANPVLVNTTLRGKLVNYLPTPLSFDHVITGIKVDNKMYFIDPTAANQRGTLADLYLPDYKLGLVISDTTTSLTTLPFATKSKIDISEMIKIKSIEGDATLTVRTAYVGSDADYMRDYFAQNSTSEIQKNYENFYAKIFEHITVDSIYLSDTDSSGMVKVNEHYTISNIWENKDSINRVKIFPYISDGYFVRPEEKRRTMPVKIGYPYKITESISIEMPEDWNTTESVLNLKNSNFIFNSKFWGKANKVFLHTYYETLKDHITAEEFEKYMKDVKEYDREVNFEITHRIDVKK